MKIISVENRESLGATWHSTGDIGHRKTLDKTGPFSLEEPGMGLNPTKTVKEKFLVSASAQGAAVAVQITASNIGDAKGCRELQPPALVPAGHTPGRSVTPKVLGRDLRDLSKAEGRPRD